MGEILSVLELKTMHIHPFPARMAPALAKAKISQLPAKSKILDPMCGSGTTLRQSIEAGHIAVGWDIDPLAVKMSRVWCQRFNVTKLRQYKADIEKKLRNTQDKKCRFSNCPETQKFVEYWFADEQRRDLNKLSLTLEELLPKSRTLDFFQIAMSRIIVTKFKGASLAWDISHSRPHKKKQENDFETIEEFFKSVDKLINTICENPCDADARIVNVDCRKLKSKERFDAIITSPPYLNAIDYMRGHKFSLIWMGHTIPQLREIRQQSIGSEKGRPDLMNDKKLQKLADTVCQGNKIKPRVQRFLFRYISDCENLFEKLKQHLDQNGNLIFVIGNSTLYGTRIQNDKLLELLAKKHGFKLHERKSRKIMQSARYLPINIKNQIGNRMKTETILHFVSN